MLHCLMSSLSEHLDLDDARPVPSPSEVPKEARSDLCRYYPSFVALSRSRHFCRASCNDAVNFAVADAHSMDKQKALLFGSAAAIRLLLFAAFPSLTPVLTGRVEISTPVTSFKRCAHTSRAMR